MIRLYTKSLIVVAITLVALTAGAVQADVILQDANSTVYITPTSQVGMHAWLVDSKSYDAQQWFWYRIGEAGGESSIDTLGAPVVTQPMPNYATLVYGNNTPLIVTLVMNLVGFDPGSGSSDINEVIRLKNNTSSAMTVHFFEYNNYTLSDLDTVVFDNANHVYQYGHNDVLEENYNGWSGEGSVTGSPLHEAAMFPVTRTNLNDPSPTTFTNIDTAGPGNVTWAFEWDVTIAAGKTFTISKDKLLNVPEPSCFVLLAAFGVCLAIAGLRKR
jgi:hypothetical protein